MGAKRFRIYLVTTGGESQKSRSVRQTDPSAIRTGVRQRHCRWLAQSALLFNAPARHAFSSTSPSADVIGEGEHKVMDYIRRASGQHRARGNAMIGDGSGGVAGGATRWLDDAPEAERDLPRDAELRIGREGLPVDGANPREVRLRDRHRPVPAPPAISSDE